MATWYDDALNVEYIARLRETRGRGGSVLVSLGTGSVGAARFD